MKQHKLIIVDDHQLFRHGLRMLLSDMENIAVVAEAANGEDFLEFIEKEPVDIALMDIAMPGVDGVEATRLGMAINPEMKIIAISMFGDEEYYYKMIEAGVKGFVLKDSDSEELEKALNTIIDGGTYFSQELLRSIIMNMGNQKNAPKVEKEAIKLSKRELEVLKLICDGDSNAEIADTLCISQRTVERHRSNLLTKTGAKNSINLVMYAIKHKLVEI